MTSIPAQKVAEEVLAYIGKGKKPNVKAIAIKRGYASTTAGSGLVQKTKSYQNVISPVIKEMELARRKALKEINKKDLTKERYRDLGEMTDKMTKNLQLLQGKSTENVAVLPITNVFRDE